MAESTMDPGEEADRFQRARDGRGRTGLGLPSALATVKVMNELLSRLVRGGGADSGGRRPTCGVTMTGSACAQFLTSFWPGWGRLRHAKEIGERAASEGRSPHVYPTNSLHVDAQRPSTMRGVRRHASRKSADRARFHQMVRDLEGEVVGPQDPSRGRRFKSCQPDVSGLVRRCLTRSEI